MRTWIQQAFFLLPLLAWDRNREWPLMDILSHEVIIFTPAAVRLIITIIPTYKKKKLELLSTLLLVSSWLMWREAFSSGPQEKEALGASLSCMGAAEQKLRRSWGGRLFRGAILLAWLELCEICSGHYETFAFAIQLECGNCLSRTSAKPASSRLETTLSSSYLPDINYCSLLLASQQPAEKVRPFSNSAAEIAESATSQSHLSVTALERGMTRRDPKKGLKHLKVKWWEIRAESKAITVFNVSDRLKKGTWHLHRISFPGTLSMYIVPSWLCCLSRWGLRHRKVDDPTKLVY